VTLLLSAVMASTTRLPGDVAIAGFLQSVAPEDNSWAEAITTSAKTPWNFILLAITILLSRLIAGWRAAVIAAVCFAGLSLFGLRQQDAMARLRPSHSYSFPSIFALTYAATIGYLAILVWYAGAGRMRWAVVLAFALLMFIGGSARVVLGAHWPSEVMGSYLIGLVWAAFLVSLYPGRKPGA
jgi:undecaprenyl-diphosphatase